MELLLDIWRYAKQMLPLAAAALLVFGLTRPWRRKNALRREAAMAFFVAYCAGLAALTLFPANFWTFSGQSKFFLFLPWNVVMSNLAYLPPCWSRSMKSGGSCRGELLGNFFAGGEHHHVHAHRIFPGASVEKLEVVEVPSSGLLHLLYH